MRYQLIIGCFLAAASLTASAQSSTKSPYSQYGIGVLSDQSQGMSRGMNGVGVALQQGNLVNTLNPASYGAVDSLTMIFDAGVSGQVTNFKEGGTRQNAHTANFEYITAQFRAWRNVGFAVGIRPLSNVGYSYSSTGIIDHTHGALTETYAGSGGLHEAFVGMGWRPFKPLSLGFNAGYVWGDLDRTVTTVGNSYISTLQKQYSVSVRNYTLNAGVQWQQPLGKKDKVTLGATLGIGHKLNADPEMDIINVSKSDTTSFSIKNGLELPWSWAAGLAWQHGDKWLVAADVEMQQWSKTHYPLYDGHSYYSASNIMKDRMRLAAGAEWTPNAMSRHYLNRVHYRLGVGMTTPYYKIGNQDGPKDISASIGLGLPIQNGYNNRSVLNVSAQWVRSEAKNLITENTFRLTVGVTFNERWFAKWKVE